MQNGVTDLNRYQNIPEVILKITTEHLKACNFRRNTKKS